jgi:hypothetical protein
MGLSNSVFRRGFRGAVCSVLSGPPCGVRRRGPEPHRQGTQPHTQDGPEVPSREDPHRRGTRDSRSGDSPTFFLQSPRGEPLKNSLYNPFVRCLPATVALALRGRLRTCVTEEGVVHDVTHR